MIFSIKRKGIPCNCAPASTHFVLSCQEICYGSTLHSERIHGTKMACR